MSARGTSNPTTGHAGPPQLPNVHVSACHPSVTRWATAWHGACQLFRAWTFSRTPASPSLPTRSAHLRWRFLRVGRSVRAAWHRTICPSRQSCTSACARIASTGAAHGCRTFAQATCRVRSGGWSRQTGARAKSTGWSPIASGARAIGGSANGACRVHERERSLDQGPWSDQRAPARTRRPFLRGVLPAWIPSCVGTNKPSMVMRRRIVRRKELRS